MAIYYGHEYEVSVRVHLKVAIDKRTNEEDIEEEAFCATCRLYEHDSKVTVVDNTVISIDNSQQYFTVADVELDLRVKVTAHDYDEAYEEAEGMVQTDLPAGVAWYDCEPYDAYRGDEAWDWDMVVGE